jgi:hypothetical protein
MPDSLADSRQAGAEIEITPEMVEAAATVLLDRCGDEFAGVNWAREIAEDVLSAAIGAARKTT